MVLLLFLFTLTTWNKADKQKDRQSVDWYTGMHIPPPFPAELCITSHITEEQKQKQFAGCLWPQNDASRKQGESNTQESHSVSEPGPEVLHVVGKETLPRSVTGQCYGQRNLTSQHYRPMLWAKKPYLAALQANAMGKETLPRSVTGQCYGQRNLTSQRYRPMLLILLWLRAA